MILFYILAAIAIASALMVVTRKNAVSAAAYLVIAMCALAGLFVQLGSFFIAVFQIIVYAGAILVLFLFVIMLLNLRKEETEIRFQKQWIYAAAVSAVLVIFFVLIVGKMSVLPPLGEYSIEAIQAEGSMMTIGKVLYTRYLLPFEIASVVLLVAIIGAVVLAKRRIQ